MGDSDRLPTDLAPTKYHLYLHTFRFAPEWSYQGTVTISCLVHTPVTAVQFHAKELEIQSVHVQNGNQATIATATDIRYDVAQERAVATLSGTVTDAEITLKIEFAAPIGDAMCGCYRSTYTSGPEAAEQYMISTQFQACEARKAFPCFDEPNLKACFVLEMESPSDMLLLSNMPQKSNSVTAGITRVVFEETPRMSTYLLAWAMGDFDYIEAFTEREYNGKRLPVRVYATRGLQSRCKFALGHAVRTLDLLSHSLSVDYPLPKCDLVAVHELAHGAMENWGLVTFRPTSLLCDDDKSDSAARQHIAYIISHELSHQWFGNLVTMNWWDDLWLNEGFATYIGWWAVDRLHPEWQIWVRYLVEDFQQGLQLDSLQSSHPVHVGVGSAAEIIQLFDQISYLKGSAIIRMLAAFLGVEVFFRGVRRYLEAHEYSNASTTDLWRALSAVSDTDVDALMSPWVEQTGYPLLSLSTGGDIKQARYDMLGTTDGDRSIWPIPVTYKAGRGTAKLLLEARETRLGQSKSSFCKLDTGHHGFYRTLYPVNSLTDAFEHKNWQFLCIEDKIGLLGDIASLVVSGHLSTPTLLSLVLQAAQREKNSSIWSLVWKAVQKVQVTFAYREKMAQGLQNYVLRLIESALAELRYTDSYWTVAEDDTYESVSLRKNLLAMATLGTRVPAVLAEGMNKFEAEHDVHADLVGLLHVLGVQEGGAGAYKKIKDRFLDGDTAPDKRESYLVALAHTRDAAQLVDVLDIATFSGDLTMAETYTFGLTISENSTAQELVWDVTRRNWDQPGVKRLREIGRGKGIDHWMKRSLRNVSDDRTRNDMAAFFGGKDVEGFNRGLNQVLEQIDINTQYRLRDEKLLEEWLNAEGYLD